MDIRNACQDDRKPRPPKKTTVLSLLAVFLLLVGVAVVLVKQITCRVSTRVHVGELGSILAPTPSSWTVSPVVETVQVRGEGDGADDPAIWIHPSDLSLSTIIGTNKSEGQAGGLHVFSLGGSEIQFVPDGRTNNVDLRYNFPLGSFPCAIVAASNVYTNSIAVYRVNPKTRQLESVAVRTITPGVRVHGLCMYRSPSARKYYVFVNSKSGEVEQWEIFDDGRGKVAGKKVRAFDVGGTTEGCVADDVLAKLYIGEQHVGIWKYGAEPEAGTARVQVDTTGPDGHLVSDVEGLTIYYAGPAAGYLIASSQGNSTFVVYRRDGDNRFQGTFRIVAGGSIDRVTVTDGIDVTNFSLGAAFPRGLFVAHDMSNAGGTASNYKLVPWPPISKTVCPALAVDTSWDPRNVGRTGAARRESIAFSP